MPFTSSRIGSGAAGFGGVATGAAAGGGVGAVFFATLGVTAVAGGFAAAVLLDATGAESVLLAGSDVGAAGFETDGALPPADFFGGSAVFVASDMVMETT